MELATILSVVQTILTAFQTLDELAAKMELATIFTISDFEDVERELEDLLNTVSNAKSILEDAESKQGALSSQEKNYFVELKGAVYDTDDVLDEFVTLLKQKQAIESSDANAEFEDLQNAVDIFKSVLEDAESNQNEVSSHEKYYIKEFDEFIAQMMQQQSYDKCLKQVKSFLFGFINYTDCMFDKVKVVNKKFDHIVSKSSKLRMKVETKPIKSLNRESSSFVSVNDPIVGRGAELEKIIDMLLSSDDDHQPSNVTSLAIVGMGGLGKTALAQLVYHDPRITSAFPLKSWTCIGDHNLEQWSLVEVFGKVARDLLKGSKLDELTSLERFIDIVKTHLEGKKYLLVLDDVWTESYYNWKELEKYLMVGESGSRIVVTTRSKKTAKIVGGVRVHELQGLSEDNSWLLFESMAFRPEQRVNPDDELVNLGQDIVKKCINVPLAIRVVASLLHGESKPTWQSFRDKELADIGESDDRIKIILSLSYHQLDYFLKSCFAYCAIFPKDFHINKQLLISLWLAQGYINVEKTGEEYFRILLQRCFFQDVKENVVGEIKRFKIHDLLHDIAEQAAGKEVCRMSSNPFMMDKKVRHILFLHDYCPHGTFNKTHIRTCLQVNATGGSMWESDKLLGANLLANSPFLRSLDLSCLFADRLPESIGKLFHLRYLNLAYSELEVLPNSITKLVNLQTLNLCGCIGLKELPKDVCKLVDLSTLNIARCIKLSHMPSKLDSLTNLHTLGQFVVGRASILEQHCFSGLRELQDLNNLKGSLEIRINVDKGAKYVKEDHGGGGYIIGKIHLQKIYIEFTNRASENIEWEQMLLEEMQPHENIKKLFLRDYNGETMPRWPRREDNSTLFYFPNLVKLKISRCQQLRSLHSLEKLSHLKTLRLEYLPNVEYVVNVNLEAPSASEGSSFFRCLEQLDIYRLPKLKGWWPGSKVHNEQQIEEPLPCFAQLMTLVLRHCPLLKVIPICSPLYLVNVTDCDVTVFISNMSHSLGANYKCLLPSKSRSRMITLSYLNTFVAK